MKSIRTKGVKLKTRELKLRSDVNGQRAFQQKGLKPGGGGGNDDWKYAHHQLCIALPTMAVV
jgi:hypothetical protein